MINLLINENFLENQIEIIEILYILIKSHKEDKLDMKLFNNFFEFSCITMHKIIKMKKYEDISLLKKSKTFTKKIIDEKSNVINSSNLSCLSQKIKKIILPNIKIECLQSYCFKILFKILQ